jgi:hypothetical protein
VVLLVGDTYEILAVAHLSNRAFSFNAVLVSRASLAAAAQVAMARRMLTGVIRSSGGVVVIAAPVALDLRLTLALGVYPRLTFLLRP